MEKALDIKWTFNNYSANTKSNIDHLSESKAKEIHNYHKSFPMYKETPLLSLNNLASELSLGNIFIKDESKRFGLNAFKVLGGSYAAAVYLAQKHSKDIEKISYHMLKSNEFKDRNMTFVTATDGNHGRGIAWTARELGYKSLVFMPKGSSTHRIESIEKEGGKVIVLDSNYDDAVRYAQKYAEDKQALLMQDTSLEGYTDIPLWIMQGYMTIAHEIGIQLDKIKEKPSHIFLQAGVGSFAAAILGYFKNKLGDDIKTIIVEPKNAAPFYKSAIINDGKPHAVSGDLKTIMAGLSCGEPNPIAWPTIRDYADLFFSCPDYIAEKGMRLMAKPLGADKRIVSGESGAPGLGLLDMIMRNEKLVEIKEKLQLNENSNIIIISTEGDTDPVSYKNIVVD